MSDAKKVLRYVVERDAEEGEDAESTNYTSREWLAGILDNGTAYTWRCPSGEIARAALGDTPEVVDITGDGSVQSNVDSAVEPPQPPPEPDALFTWAAQKAADKATEELQAQTGRDDIHVEWVEPPQPCPEPQCVRVGQHSEHLLSDGKPWPVEPPQPETVFDVARRIAGSDRPETEGT